MGKRYIKNILSANVISVSPEDRLAEVVLLMERHQISCVVVVKDKRPVGILTERDIVFLANQNDIVNDIAIAEVMSESVITANIEVDIFEAYRILEINSIRHLIVVNYSGEIAGVVTQTDIINSLGLEYFIELKNISKIMTKHVALVGPENSVRNALSIMAKHAISCVVVEEDNHPVGILTESDVVRLFRHGVDLETLLVKEAMSQPVTTLPADATVHEAAFMMDQKKIRRLVITSAEGRILGLVTQYDIIKNFEFKYIDFLKEIIRGKEKKIEETEKILNEKIVLDNILRYSTDMAIVATDIDYRIVYYNPSAERIFGYAAEKIVGETIIDVHAKEGVELSRFHKSLENIRNDGAYKYVFKLKRKSEVKLVGATVSGIRDKDYNLIGFVLMAHDITKQVAMEEELLKARKLESIGILAGGIAHDFNNLLTAVLGYISLAKNHAGLGQQIVSELERAESASRHAGELTRLLITFAKGGAPVKRLAHIGELLKIAVSFALKDANVVSTFTIPDDLWPVEIDEGQLKWVIHNIVRNSREAMPEGGAINITAQNVIEKKCKHILISIKDTGVGIPEENLTRIFDPYFTTKEMGSQKGMGLGLSICYSIIKNHRGRIVVESEIGAGTRVDVYLPAQS